MSLRTRIVLLVLLAILTPATLLVIYLFKDRDSDIADAEQSLNALATYAAGNLNDKASGTVQLLHGLSRAPELDVPDKAACSAFLGDVLERYPQYTGLLTIRPDGQLHCDSLRSGRTLDLNDRAYFKQARDSNDPAFEVVFGRLTGTAVLQIAFPARDSRGKLRYVLLASLNLAQFNERIATASPYAGMEAEIWDSKGTLMARYPDNGPKKLAGSSLADSDLYRFVQSEQGDAAELPGPDGMLKIWSRSVLPVTTGGALRIALGIPRDVLLASANRDIRSALASLAFGSLLAFVAALLVAELGIRRPVTRIITAKKQQADGNFSARVGPPYPRGELGELMTAIDRTAASVQAQQAEIGRGSEELRRTNRTLRVLSAINSLIVRVRDRDELFREACRIAVEQGHLKAAWIGMVDRSAMKVVPIASAGAELEFLSHFKNHFPLREDASDGNTMTARAVREKKAIVSNDTRNDSQVYWVNQIVEKGIAAIAILPLLVSDETVGVLALYSDETGFFDETEMRMFHELAGDISFAVDHIGKQERLDYLAYYDELTGLANRSLFLERVAQHMRSAVGGGHKLAIGLVDLERFKNINDSLGRPAGDALLKQVAEWLTRNLGDARLLARLGADHFAMVLPEINPQGNVARLVEKFMQAFLEHPFRLNDAVFRIAVKVGVAVCPDDGIDADTLFRNAEAALKKAKASGDRYLFYTQEMTETVAGKLTLENELRQALDNKEFVLHYQPKVSLTSGKLTGAEALIRWNDPRTGLVPPGKFIPMLEETGLIFEVGRWALRQAIADYLRWRDAGLPAVRIAVNVSPLQLRNPDFISEIRKVIAVDTRAPGGLELEITESLVMEDIMHNIASLQAIRAMGVTTAIDDFGTGFSSLAYLAKLPVDTLKIDRSFVTDMVVGPDGLALVSTIISLAHSLKLKVVAEGVETEEQSRLLRLLKCDEMQGFLFSKPVPAEIFETSFLAMPPAAV